MLYLIIMNGEKKMGFFTIKDMKRIVNARSDSRVRNILCRPEFEKKRLNNGRTLIYRFDAGDLKEFKEIYFMATPAILGRRKKK